MSIEAVGLTREFGKILAVDHLDLTVQPGQIFALLGPNGAGKTTAVRLITGLLRPSSGSCRVGGYDVLRQPGEVRRIVGLMTDDPGLYGEMDLWSYLDWFGSLYRLLSAVRHKRIEELLEQFSLHSCAHAPLRTLSKGNQQKVALARALLHEPHVLLLDEPTSALDPISTISLRKLFRSLRDAGRTIVLCTHNLREAEHVADTVAIITAGKIVHRQVLAVSSRRVFRVRMQEKVNLIGSDVERVEGVVPGSARMDGAGRTLEFATVTPETTNPAVVRMLCTHGLGVIELFQYKESLEEIYLRCLGQAES